MDHSILAIVRYTLTKPVLEAGELVRTQRSINGGCGSDQPLVCLRDRQPDQPLVLPAGALLPLSQFLRRQPLPVFWALLHRQLMLEGLPCFVRLPRSMTFGAVPHRFESEGECRYFLRDRALSQDVFLMARITRARK